MEAMRGLGVDRHLFGLYIMAKGLKMDPMPKMFTDKVRAVGSSLPPLSPCTPSNPHSLLLHPPPGFQLLFSAVDVSDTSENDPQVESGDLHSGGGIRDSL